MRSRSNWMKGIGIAIAVVTGACVAVWQPAQAQLSAATLRGFVLTATGQGEGGVEVSATNTDSGFVYRTRSNSDGSYVLNGLPPGKYAIRTGTEAEQKPQIVSLAVAESASLDLVLPAVPIEQVTIIGALERADVKTSEVATSVSPKQMQLLPQVSRNFLSFADLAPGVRVNQDQTTGFVSVQSGAQNQDNINVYIDGVSQKNYVLRGGLVGQDSSRGNPFPQSALSEYRIVNQNYKAEFDQVSSAAITAATRSGTNELHGDAFVDYTGNEFVQYSPIELANKSAGINRPGFDQEQYGMTLGGPIIQDRMHYFIAYEGKHIGDARETALQHADELPNAGIVPSLRALQGATTDSFREDLVFTKVDAQIAADQRVDLSVRVRRENDLVPINPTLSAPDNQSNRRNNETHIDLKHEWTVGAWLNEARAGYQRAEWNPHSNSTTPLILYNISPSNNENNMNGVIDVGGSPDAQDRIQKGFYLQDDLSFGGIADHAFKAGFKVDFITFDLSGTAFSVPTLVELIDNVSGIPTVQADRTVNAEPPVDANFRDTMIGLYLQDDWDVTRRLQLNLGLRWDYETNMLDNDYVTPADRIAALYGPDTRTVAGITAPPGQTYAQSLALGGINIGNYISNGSSRKPYTGAIQPRVGFSYDLLGDKQTVFFGAYGRAYDRKVATNALDEKQKNLQPGGDIWLVRNDFKMPYTDQYGAGVRQGLGVWNTELAYTYSYSYNQFNWFSGNRDPRGGWGQQSLIDPLFGGPAGFGNLLLGDFVGRVRTETAYLKAEKPYTTSSGWGMTVTYTWSQGWTTNREWTNDPINWTYGKPGVGWYPSDDVERQRIVATAITDRVLPLGVVLGAKWTYGSGLPFQITDCHLGFSMCVYREGFGGHFDQVDASLSRRFGVGFGALTVRLDILNILGDANYGGYDGWVGGPSTPPKNVYGGDNAHFGVPATIIGPMRTYKVGLRYDF